MARHSRLALLLVAMAIPLVLLAPALSAHAARPAAHAHAMVHVTIQGFAFSPQTLNVAPGTTVVWTNQDSVAHTVTSDTAAWDSGNLATNQTFSHTFAKAGTYSYHCSIHSFMTARVIVSRSGVTPSLHVTLRPQAFSGVTGSATVTYNAATKMTTVKVMVQHLEPGSSHPEHIHAGTCSSNGPVLVVLKTIKADAMGTGVATTVFKGSVMNRAAYINVHMGPGLALTQYTVLACGELGKTM